jgi:ssDNA-binding Zn-finger/Zn-ribbon topoisomerase 1
MYCPKCDRTIKKERLAQINQELKERYKKDSLERGLCPVCGTDLIDLEKVRK